MTYHGHTIIVKTMKVSMFPYELKREITNKAIIFDNYINSKEV
jgi:hypothetical protein